MYDTNVQKTHTHNIITLEQLLVVYTDFASLLQEYASRRDRSHTKSRPWHNRKHFLTK